MNKDYYVFVFIPTYNCVDKITATIESVFNQTFDNKRLKVIAVDNCSNDGTYEKLLELTQRNNDQISIYRLSKPTKLTRLFQKAAEIIQYMPVVDYYSTILLPGSVIYPDFIEKCTTLFQTMKYFEGNMLICETDLMDKDGNEYYQEPIYTDNCILKANTDCAQFLITGIGHRIQPFYRGFSISTTTPLHIVTHGVDYNDWFNKLWGTNGDCIYIKDKLACLEVVELGDSIGDLMKRLTLLKRNYYSMEINERNIVGEDSISYENRDLSYKCLSILALKHAIKELKRENLTSANDCLLFAEMVYLNIVNEDIYIDTKNVVKGLMNRECLYKYEVQDKSIHAPRGSFIF